MNSATGTHTRVQMQREGQALVPHATVMNYDPLTGIFLASFDFQEAGADQYVFTPTANLGEFADQDGLKWTLVR